MQKRVNQIKKRKYDNMNCKDLPEECRLFMLDIEMKDYAATQQRMQKTLLKDDKSLHICG